MKRIQEYVETLDALKLKNSAQSNNGDGNHVQEQRFSDGYGGMPPQSRWRVRKSSFTPGVNQHPLLSPLIINEEDKIVGNTMQKISEEIVW